MILISDIYTIRPRNGYIVADVLTLLQNNHFEPVNNNESGGLDRHLHNDPRNTTLRAIPVTDGSFDVLAYMHESTTELHKGIYNDSREAKLGLDHTARQFVFHQRIGNIEVPDYYNFWGKRPYQEEHQNEHGDISY